MYKALKNSLSSLSAEEDKEFHFHFVETKYLKRLVSYESDIIYGTKGVGKTALRRALAELNGDFFFSTITIDLDSISFEAVYNRLTALNSTVKHEMHTLSRATWKNTLLSYALLSVSEKLPNTNCLKNKITTILKEEGFLKPNGHSAAENSNYRIMNVIENFFQKIISLPFSKEKTLVGVTAEQQNIVNKFPLNDNILIVLKEVIEVVKKSSKKALVCIDGFDSIVKHTSDSREAIFAGLIDAVYFYRLDNELSEAFCFKAFLPQELTLEANTITWDGDKHLNNIHYVSWEENDFKSFVEKRFAPFSKKKYSRFNDVWSEYLPERILNTTHGIEENTFEYILRHTLYRPRQVLNHIFTIISHWDETNSGSDKIQPSFIPGVIAKNNKIMATKVAEHLSRIYPNVINFLKSWQGSSSIIEVSKFREKINRYFFGDAGLNEHNETDKLFDELFDFGIFGVHANTQTNPISKRVEFCFAFVGDNINSSIHNSMKDNDLIAFSPMFREYCGCHATKEGVIVPITLDNFL